MTTIVPPEDYCAAVQRLPETQFPYGKVEECPMGHPIQSVLFHYEVSRETVMHLVTEGIVKFKAFKAANPDGTDDQRAFYETAVNSQIRGNLQRFMAKEAFRRILLPDPFAAIVEDPVLPPSKRVCGAPNMTFGCVGDMGFCICLGGV